MTSLITIVRSKYLDAIRSVNPPGKWKILVVDEFSQKLLGAALKQFDILEENVTLIESITSYRDRQPQFEAIYILMPTTANVERIIRDFAPGDEQYAAAHLFFLDTLSEPLSQQLVESQADRYLKALRDLNLNFWPIESQVFSMKAPEQFFSLYSPPRSENAVRPSRERLEEDLQLAGKMIANMCINLDEYPYIRYYMPSHHLPLGALKPNDQTRPPPPPEASSRWRTNLARGAASRAYEDADTEFATKLLALHVQQFLDEHKKQNADWPKKPETRPRGTLLITDRSMDTLAPFTHEFTYQAMSNDLLPIDDGTKYTYKFQTAIGAFEDRTAVLSDSDNVYTEVRHMHMREAIDKLIADFNHFLQENAGFKGEGVASLNDMKDMLASLPQYQEQREKFSLHLNMAQECMGIFERDKLPVVANVEQNCSTGMTAEGKSPKNLVEEMVPLLDSREVVNMNKVRIIALYVQYRDGVPDEDRRRLYQHARLSLAEQDAVNAIVYLGAKISRGPNDRDTRKRLKNRSSQDDYDLSRYKPLLRAVLEDHVNGRLDISAFPYVRDSPQAVTPATSLRASSPASPGVASGGSLRSQKPIWHKGAQKGGAAEIRQRVLVFIAGGMTYSEMRETYLLSKSLNKDIIIGSTHNFTPRRFVDDLKVLELQGVGSHAIPNGLRSIQGGSRPFQAFYDERYFTKDAPPPQRPSTAPLPNTKSNSGKLLRPTAPAMESSASYGGKEEKKKKKGLFRF